MLSEKSKPGWPPEPGQTPLGVQRRKKVNWEAQVMKPSKEPWFCVRTYKRKRLSQLRVKVVLHACLKPAGSF